MNRILKLSACCMTALLLSACDFSSKPEHHGRFYYSNPTNMPATITVDQKTYDIAPFSVGVVKLDPGLHTMQDGKGDEISFMVFDFNDGGILNPHRQMYYALSEVYANDDSASHFQPVKNSVIINGYELEIPLKSANDPVMGANYLPCSYPIGTPFPEQIVVGDQKLVGNIKSKCFDKPELLAYFKETYEMDLTPESPQDHGKDSITEISNLELPSSDFPDEKMTEIAEQIVSLLKEIKVSNDAKIHEKLNPQFHELILALLKAKQKLPHRNDPQLSTLYNNFIDQVSAIRTNSVWIR